MRATTGTGADPVGNRIPPVLLAVALGAWGLVLAGCAGRETSRPALPDSTYVQVMARLALVRGDGGAAIRRRGAVGASGDSLERRAVEGVLREAGVEEESLLEFARQVGDEPERMSALWERIQSLSDSLRVQGWDPPGPLPPMEPLGGS